MKKEKNLIDDREYDIIMKECRDTPCRECVFGIPISKHASDCMAVKVKEGDETYYKRYKKALVRAKLKDL